MGTGSSTGALGEWAAPGQWSHPGGAQGSGSGSALDHPPTQGELGLLQATAAAKAGGTTTAAVSEYDIWRGKGTQIRRCPLALALPPLHQTNARAGENMRKQQPAFLEHQRGSVLTLLATAPKIKLASPFGSPLGHEGKTQLGTQQPGKVSTPIRECLYLCLSKGSELRAAADTTLQHSPLQAQQPLLSPVKEGSPSPARSWQAAPHSPHICWPQPPLCPSWAMATGRTLLSCSQALGRATGTHHAVAQTCSTFNCSACKGENQFHVLYFSSLCA